MEAESAASPLRRDQALAFIMAEIARGRGSPSMVEIARHLGVSSTRAKQLVDDLRRVGAIERTPGTQRAIRVCDVAQSRQQLADVLRALGWVAADAGGELRGAIGGETMPIVAVLGHVSDDRQLPQALAP